MPEKPGWPSPKKVEEEEKLLSIFSFLQVEYMSQQTKFVLAILKNLFHNSPKSAEFLNIPDGLYVPTSLFHFYKCL